MNKIYRNEYIENLTEQRLREYEKKNGTIQRFCIPIDRIIENFGLNILYDKIEEKQGENILGGLNIEQKLIVINESHMKVFKAKPGLENFTKAHELGHWDIFVRGRAEGQFISLKCEFNKSEFFYRNSSMGKVTILSDAWIDSDIYDVYKMYDRRKDHPHVESAVNRYASYLLMPRYFIKEYIAINNLMTWNNLYKMAEIFNVTISSLCVRLQKLKIIYIENKNIYKTKDVAIGQKMLSI